MEGEKTYINMPKCTSYTLLTIELSAKISGYEPYGKNLKKFTYRCSLAAVGSDFP